jgi:predicted nucleic acid-binding protein
MEAPSTPTILLDTNVFVSAIKTVPRVTDSLRLIVYLIEADVRLVGNELLAAEYLRYAQVLSSPTAAALAAAILGRMEVIHVEERFVLACKPYFGGRNVKDCVHAATCLQLGATLVSNDHDFDAIEGAGIIRRMTIGDAVRQWLAPRKR